MNEYLEDLKQDLLFALNTGKITQDEFIKEHSKIREKESNTIWSLVSREETMHQHVSK